MGRGKAMKMFRVYFNDGNQRLFEAENIAMVINFVVYELNESAEDIYKVEEI